MEKESVCILSKAIVLGTDSSFSCVNEFAMILVFRIAGTASIAMASATQRKDIESLVLNLIAIALYSLIPDLELKNKIQIFEIARILLISSIKCWFKLSQ